MQIMFMQAWVWEGLILALWDYTEQLIREAVQGLGSGLWLFGGQFGLVSLYSTRSRSAWDRRVWSGLWFFGGQFGLVSLYSPLRSRSAWDRRVWSGLWFLGGQFGLVSIFNKIKIGLG